VLSCAHQTRAMPKPQGCTKITYIISTCCYKFVSWNTKINKQKRNKNRTEMKKKKHVWYWSKM